MPKTCYYEILDVPRDVEQSKIKKAYFKQSLKYHPDKNPSEDAKQMFQAINEAYEVLSDVNERSWYDSHRQQILNGQDQPCDQDVEEASFGGIQINNFMKTTCFQAFGDGQNDYYAVYRNLIEKLKSQEDQAFHNNTDENGNIQFDKMPGFGDSSTDPSLVNDFYVKWENFVSYKNFSWADKYNKFLNQVFRYRNDDESRYVKRIIQRENQKERNKERKRYIQVIRDLIQFVKSHDKRHKKYVKDEEERILRRQKEKEKEAEEKQKQLKAMRQKQREEEQKRFAEEEAAMQEKDYNKDHFNFVEEHKEQEDFYCEVCDKDFRSENQLENHKNSKLHKKKVKDLLSEVALQEELDELEQMDEEEKIDEQSSQQQKSQPYQQGKSKKNKKKNKQNDDFDEFEQQQQQQDQQQQQITQNVIQNNVSQKKKSVEVEQDDSDIEDDLMNFGKQFIKKEQQVNKSKNNYENEDQEEEQLKNIIQDSKGKKNLQKSVDKDEVGQKTISKKERRKQKEALMQAQQATQHKENDSDDDDDQENQKKIKKGGKKPQQKNSKTEDKDDNNDDESELINQSKKEKKPQMKSSKISQVQQKGIEDNDDDDESEQISQSKKEKKSQSKSSKTSLVQQKATEDNDVDDESEQKSMSKKEKRKLKEAQKADVIQCNVCKEEFTSRSKMFQHVKDKGHALQK